MEGISMDVTGYAGIEDLEAILDSSSVAVASPFLSPWTLERINPNRHNSFRLITRLPTSFNAPEAFIENDPRPIKNAMELLGRKLAVFALPTLHAKMFFNEHSSWVGSANFTNNGFSGKQELLLRFDGQHPELHSIYKQYIAESKSVSILDINKLIRWMEMGLTEIDNRKSKLGSSPDESELSNASYSDFVNWLSSHNGVKRSIAKHLFVRSTGVNNMSGHIYPAFNGTLSFLRKNPMLITRLEPVTDAQIPADIISKISAFIKKYGDEYRGTKGGYWRSYLSTALGGNQDRGGAGNTVVKKCLVILPLYMKDRGLAPAP
jgi:hypothetical protein